MADYWKVPTVRASFYEMTWGMAITPWPTDKVLKNLIFRPEFRWDFADQPVFCGGRQGQLTERWPCTHPQQTRTSDVHPRGDRSPTRRE